MDELESAFPRFRLRSDFAHELCYLDRIRNPVSPQLYGMHCAEKKIAFSWAGLREVNARRSQRKAPEVYIFGSVIPTGNTEPKMYISGGRSWLPVPRDGLFDDLILRAQAVMGLSPSDPSPLLLPTLSEPATQPVFSETVVVHFSEQGFAEIHLESSARKLTDAFNDPS